MCLQGQTNDQTKSNGLDFGLEYIFFPPFQIKDVLMI